MPFQWHTTHYQNLDAYKQALLPFHKPSWISGITLHHTLVPLRSQWRGQQTMDGLRFFYEKKGWESGPHLFLAALTPGPFTNGIWAGTPLAHPGTHAGKCNASHIGIEIVGNYDHEPWPDQVAELVYTTVVALMRWGCIAPEHVQGHRECNSPKTCPGNMINMDHVRAELARRIAV